MPTLDELQKELEELEERKNEIASDYKTIQNKGFEKHKDCCTDICDEINTQIKKLNNIKADLSHKKETATPKTSQLIHRGIMASDEQMKALIELRGKLYARAICNCESR